jgi:hypothetical protein
MRRAIVVLVMILLTATSAAAVTLKDIVDLTKAGLGDDVLLALIEVDGGVFDVDAATLARLKAAGVSEKVIVAVVRSGRVRPPEPQPLADFVAEQQQAPVGPPPEPMTIVREVAVPYPVYVGIPVTVRGRHGRIESNLPSRIEPSITAPPLLQGRQRYLTDIPPEPTREPVYWGSGGKLRPDAWKPK